MIAEVVFRQINNGDVEKAKKPMLITSILKNASLLPGVLTFLVLRPGIVLNLFLNFEQK